MLNFGTPYWWQTETSKNIPEANQVSDETDNFIYDIVIIGGGYTGISAALTSKNFASNCLSRGLLPFGPIQSIIYRLDDIKNNKNKQCI